MTDRAAQHTIVGAGSVGLVLGAQLARAGTPVRFVTRSEDVARRIREEGVGVVDPSSGEAWQAAADAVASLSELAELSGDGDSGGDGPVFLCVRGPETEGVASALARVAPDARVVSVQNGVENEALLSRHFRRVLGAVWRQTCTRVEPNRARALGRTRFVLGAWPDAAALPAAEVEAVAAPLRAAGLDLGVSPRIHEDLWLKLCVNLMSAPNALVRRPDHRSAAFVECKARLLEEARDALAAGGIAASSCDGRDRDLEAEIRFQREALARGESARALPLYNQVWTSLRNSVSRGLAPEASAPVSLEADAYHRRILALSAEHGLPAPVNARVLAVLEDTWRRGVGPESATAEALLP